MEVIEKDSWKLVINSNVRINSNISTPAEVQTKNNFSILRDEINSTTNSKVNYKIEPPMVMIMGDSSFKHQLSEMNLRNKDFEVHCHRGATIERINEKINLIQTNTQIMRPKIMIIGVGEKNIMKNETNNEILAKFDNIIKALKQKAEARVIVGILPKAGKYDYFNAKAWVINARLELVCKLNDIIFLNLWDKFKGITHLYVNNGKCLGSVGISRLWANFLNQLRNLCPLTKISENKLKKKINNNKFAPLRICGRRTICKHFSYVNSNAAINYVESEDMGTPSDIYRTIPDGNCFFRAISYCISGTQNNHYKVREQIVNELRTNEALFMPIIEERYGNQIEQYIQEEGMDKPGVGWGTHTEIIAASKLFNINIHVFMPHVDRPIWQTFCPDLIVQNNNGTVGDIYLNNTNGNHFDVVLETKSQINVMNHQAPCNKKDKMKNIYCRDLIKSKNNLNIFEQIKDDNTSNPVYPNNDIDDRKKKSCNHGGKARKINELNCFYTNARSIGNKFNELQAINETESYDIIGISESWMNLKRHLIGEFNLPGYQLFSKDRSMRNEANSKTKGGGVLLYVKDTLNAVQMYNDANAHIESIWIKIKQKNKVLTLGIAYRAPSQLVEYDSMLYDQIRNACNTKDSVVLMGDFNFRNIDWRSQAFDGTSEQFMEVVQNCYLFQKVDKPTRGENILDLILCNEEAIVQNVKVGENLGDSDHQIIRFSIIVETEQAKNKILVPNFNRANFDGMRDGLSKKCWRNELQANSVNEMWEKFQNNIKIQMKLHVPYSEKRVGKVLNKWINRDLKNMVRNKKHAFQQLKRTQTEDNYRSYQNLRRSVKREVKKSKRTYEERIADNCKRNPKEFFKYVRNKKNVKESIGSLFNSHMNLIHDKQNIVKLLNESFLNVFTEENIDNIPIPEKRFHGNHDEELNNISVTKSEVEKAISKLNTSKTPGPDEIHARIIKEAKQQLIEPLTMIFNKSLAEGTVPDDWKKANVTPIFKTGDKKDPGNYRPISLTSVVCKMLETIIRDKLVTHLEQHSLLHNSQHGFRIGRNCTTNLLEFYDKVINLHDNGEPIDIIYLDFKKAFDKVPHKRLLSKIRAHGITGNVASWIENWLTGRLQRVTVDGVASEWMSVLSGVPQGSVLGPVLFILYINDIDLSIKSEISKFADDTKIAGKASSPEDRQSIQKDLDVLTEWANKWQMEFNVEKCNVMHVGRNNVENEYTLNGKKINKSTKVKDLGVIFTNDLKSTKHCNETACRANKMLGFIIRSFEFKTPKILLPLFNTYVRPLMEYCAPVWSPSLVKDKQKMERVQRRFTKSIPSLRNKSYEERLKSLNLFTIEKRRLRGDLIQVFKLLNNIYNVQVEAYFQRNDDLRTRNNGFKLRGKQYRANIAGHFFTNRVVSEWNKLPSWVVASTSINMFKTNLDQYFVANNIY
jgi:hypothetical protein